MELLLIASFLLGLWMNWSFALHSKSKWNNLHALRSLVGFQLAVDVCNIAVHLLLLIPWPFWGYAINPGNYLWTVNPLICRIVTVIEETTSISCAANATCIFVTNLEKQELKQERKRKMAFCFVLVTFLLGGVFAVVYTELVPLVKYGAMSGSNCPLHPFALLCDQDELKYVFVIYVACSVILFQSLDCRNNSNLKESGAKSVVNSLFKCLSLACYCTTMCALVFAFMCIPIYFLGASLYSFTFNKVKLYFDITTLAVSIGLPALLAQIHADNSNGVSVHSAESLMESDPGSKQRLIKIRINNDKQQT